MPSKASGSHFILSFLLPGKTPARFSETACPLF
jgi:hypothetical protein